MRTLPHDPEALALLRRRALGRRAVRRGRSGVPARAPRSTPGRRGRTAAWRGAWRRQSRLDEAIDEAQAAVALAPRDLGNPPHARHVYERMHRYDGRGARVLNNAATCCRTRTPARRPSGPLADRFLRLVREQDAVCRSGSPAGDAAAHRSGSRWCTTRSSCRPRVNGPDSRTSSSTRARRRRSSRGARRSDWRRRRSYHAQRRRRRDRPARPAGRRGSNSLELGTLKLRQRAVPHQEPAAADLPTQGDGEPVAARAGALDEHRLQARTSSRSGRTCPRSRRTSSCRCGVHRLATVRGLVATRAPANFVVDTGGEVISISRRRPRTR